MAAVRALRGPTARARLRALRDGQAAVRLSIGSAALSTGVLAALADRPRPLAELARATGAADTALLLPWLRVLQAVGYVRDDGPRWSITRAGGDLVRDPVLRAAHEAFPGYHTGLYRGLPELLAGGASRDDIAGNGDVIARLSQAQDPFVADLLSAVARGERPGRVLDVGCGSGGNLVTLLRAAPGAVGVAVEVDPEVADSARGMLRAEGLENRATVLTGEVTDLARRGALDAGFDVALFANAVYYVPLARRVDVLRSIGGLLSDRGVLVVVTTAAGDDVFSRHFDLELRAHRQGMELPDVDELAEQLRDAGLAPQPARRLVPGTALVGVLARRAGAVIPGSEPAELR